MFAYVVRRVVAGMILLVVMSFVTFMLFFASPIDPGRFACGKSCPPALIKQTDKALGAEVIQHEGPWPTRFERAAITVDNTGDAEGLSCALRSTDDYGTCTSVAIQFAPTTAVPLLAMYTKGVTFQMARADSRKYLPAVVDLVTSGHLDPGAVPTTVVGWADAGRAWLEPAVKLVVDRTS